MRRIAAIAMFCLSLSAPAWAEGPGFNCAKAAVGHERGDQPPGYRDFAYGGLCTVERDGRAQRELVCIETCGSAIHEMVVGDRLIGSKEIAIFTAINCDWALPPSRQQRFQSAR
ncbi:MAG: hypothetical protein K1X51_13490 [Rhodospirillaceae bacterium]|nr:hypothetical protein [Rhodospirillaceae bacterium]